MKWLARVLGRGKSAPAAAPGDAEGLGAHGTGLLHARRAAEAAAAYRAALAVEPDNHEARFNLASALLLQDDYGAALEELEHLSAQGSQLPRLLPTLGYVQCQLGSIDAGIGTLRRALAADPLNAETHRNLMLAMNYSAWLSPAEIFAEHLRFGERHQQPCGAPAPDRAWPRRLRVGYVSPDFRSHVVASFMWPILARHDRGRFEVFCYYTNKLSDEATAGMRALADRWADCAQDSDAELAARVRSDRIDILVDLAGQSAKSRPKVFALRPAPLQLTYLGYPNTTGLRAMDGRITDARADPPGEADRLHTERLLRLPRSFLCFRPGPDVVPVTPPPVLSAGQITFGCFNNFRKLSAPFLRAAARILAAAPGSRLLLKAGALDLPRVAAEVRARFAAEGIGPERLRLRGWEDKVEQHLAAYGEVDLALDSFPYNGTTTTCEALWMGVPVVTVAGERHAARVGASLLHSVGLDELVARSEVEYVERAVRLAADLPRLARLRQGMRERLRRSPLMDESGFVQDLERGYLEFWQAKLAEAAPTLSMDELTAHWNRCHDTGEHAIALEALGNAIGAAGANAGAAARLHYMAGCTLEDAARPVEAMDAYRRALALDPAIAKAHNNLGCLLEAAGDGEGAMQCYEAAVRAEPGLANARYNRGNMHKLRGRAVLAEADLRRALALEPQHADWRCALGEALALQGKPDAAIASYRAVLGADPRDVRAHYGLGNALLIVGRPEEAESSFGLAIEGQPDYAEAHSNLLLAMHYRKGDDARVMYEAHLEWARRHARYLPRPKHAGRTPAPARRLNIGYLSPNFQHHAVAWSIEPVLAAHDRSRFRTFFYSTVANPDAVTRRFMKLCDEWRDIHATSDDVAAHLIRQDRIDILVDLAGHTGGGRPLLLARKPAPVQVSWQGYPNTTGLAEMDYRITDANADPEGEADRHHTETLVRLATGFFCYAPPADAPDTGEPPVLESGRITFGCFNNLAKVTPEMIGLWSRILAELPQARLIMKAHALGEESARHAIHGHFAGNGIAAGRVDLFKAEDSHGGHLGRYREVDIALDPFPYHGTATSCEALWMGAPVVTLAGRTHLSRVGVSILRRIGLDELIAATPEEYVHKAVALARDPGRLREMRAGLRQRMRASPLLDAAGFARALEAAYLEMWIRWCSSGSSPEACAAEPLRLHIGGLERKHGWKILNIQDGAHVDFAGDCTDLGRFADSSVEEIYASHVLEHLGYQTQLPRALSEFCRVLKPGGVAMISVPDFEAICRLFGDPRTTPAKRILLMRMAFGGQLDRYDFHYVGLTHEFLEKFLAKAGFARVERVQGFGLFSDSSTQQVNGETVNLNVRAFK